MYIEGNTFDDLLRKGLSALLAHGRLIKPHKGDARELIGVTLKLFNPLARFSRTESRGVLFSALGETLWYLSGSDDFDIIEHYIPKYRERCETPSHVKISEGAYGPRLVLQLPFIIDAVNKNDTRKAVISIYREEDHGNRYDVPCTCTLQFFPRSGALHALAHMRSNDIYTGMAHDIFAFTLLQEFVARVVGLEVGHYVHQVGSFHLYESNRPAAENYLAGGIADDIPMDPMPNSDPVTSLAWLLQAESDLRINGIMLDPTGVAPYWQDLAALLRVRPLRKARNVDELKSILAALNSPSLRTFVQDEIERV